MRQLDRQAPLELLAPPAHHNSLPDNLLSSSIYHGLGSPSFAKASDGKPMFYVYILYNRITSRYYVGYSPDLKNRLKKHLSGRVLSTKSNLNYKLVFYCAFETRRLALEFEQYLKSGSGVAFMKKRFFKPYQASVRDDNLGEFPATRSPSKR